MSFVADLPTLEGGLSDVLTLLGISQNESMADEIKRLYQEADSLAVFTIQAVVALMWWCSHMGSATSDALGYSAQIQSAMATANKYQLEAWTDFLNVIHPAEIRQVYIRTTKQIEDVKKVTQVTQKVNLKPIEKEIAALQKWEKHTVNPDLKRLMAFWHAWENTYKAPVARWVTWFKKPSLFAQWAAGPLVTQLPVTLAGKSAQKHAAQIAAALVATWQTDPDTIYNSVLSWLVAG